MTGTSGRRFVTSAALALAALTAAATAAQAQAGRGQASPALQQAVALDRDGQTAKARVIFQALIDSAATPEAKARAQRDMAMSYAFAGDCADAVKYEAKAIDYWKTREAADPQNAFYQEGELADEAGRVCIDAGDLAAAEHWYRLGYELGTKEPAPQTHPKSLWDYRLAHALGRIAARRGDKAEAQRQIANARRALESDSTMAAQQARFLPYLVGYVALYTGDLKTADAELTKAIGLRGNQRDPFMHCLLAMTYEREGRKAEADAMYRKAYDMAMGHNPPSAFVRPFVRKKLGLAASG